MQSSDSLFLLPKDHTLARRFVSLRRSQSHMPFNGTHSQRHLFFCARNAIFWSLKALNISSGSRILAPSYICRAAIEPMIAYGAKVDFYAVKRDCQVDLSDLEARIDDRTRAVIAVHYFGFPQRMELIKNLCNRFGLFLIEDCAHVLQGDVGDRAMGTLGDASVFSWRKFLPMYDGGELVLNRASIALDIEWGKEPFLLTLKIAKNMLENAFYPTEQLVPNRLPIWIRAAQSIWNYLKNNVTYPDHAISFNNNSASFDERAVSLGMSRISRYVMAHSDLSAVVKSRRSNYAFLLQELNSTDGIKVLFPDFPKGVCPWVFPLFFDNIPDAHLVLRSHGIPAVTWDGVRPPLVSDSNFPDAAFLYRNLVFLPVHQCLRKSELETMVKVVKAVRKG